MGTAIEGFCGKRAVLSYFWLKLNIAKTAPNLARKYVQVY